MACAVVNSASSTVGGNTTISLAITGTTTGNGLIVMVGWYGGAVTDLSTQSPAISGESAPSMLTPSRVTAFGGNVQIGYLKTLTGSGTKTFSCTNFAVSDWQAAILEVSGQDTAAFYDSAQGQNNGTSGNASTSFTTNTNNDLIAAFLIDDGDTNPGAQAGYTKVTTGEGNFCGQYNANVGSAALNTVTMTLTSGDWAFTAAAFKPSGAFDPTIAVASITPGVNAGMIGRTARGIYG